MTAPCRFGRLEKRGAELLPKNRRVAVDENVYRLHLKKFEALEPVYVVPAGEKHKTLHEAERFWRYLWDTGADRKTTVVAVGGGMTTDMVGFAAATWMRGVPFVFVPTTLLGMVDASIGGKTAVDLITPLGMAKNVVGAFAHPQFLFYDTEFLSTLDERQRRSGMAEVFKHGLIGDEDYFWVAERLYDDALIRRSYEIKSAVVKSDPAEKGLRKVLNFGHTVGHAIEALLMETGLLHGEAVAWGMAAETLLSVEYAGLNANEADAIVKKLRDYMPPLDNFSIRDMEAMMSKDKKNENGKAMFTLLKRTGRAVYNVAVPVTAASAAWKSLSAKA